MLDQLKIKGSIVKPSVVHPFILKPWPRGEFRSEHVTMRSGAWISSAAAATAMVLLLAPQLPQVSARGVSANLTASWPSSPLFPMLETRYSVFTIMGNEMIVCWRSSDLLA